MTATIAAEPSAGTSGRRWHAVRRVVRGAEDDPRWARPALGGLLLGTALLYLVGLGSSGWANAFYSAAAQAGSKSWVAFLFGSSDASNAITVDKTPAFLWLMDLSVRVFGLSSWSVLVPQALLGIASVAMLYATVKRWSGPVAGILAGATLALTPVAVLMFRFNNPDALLVFLLTCAAYATLRATEKASPRWLVLAGALVGFGFLAKMMQAFLVLPAFALAYLVAAPTSLWRRVWHVLAAGAAVVVSAGWYVALVELWPASSRPYIGGSQNNSLLELIFGYNGFGRLTGDESGGLGNTNQDAGWSRLFGSDMGGQISWLLPAALMALVACLVLTRRAAGTDLTRAALIVWGGWLVVSGLVISLSEGIIHGYYTVALAPAIAALIGIGAVHLWRHRAMPVLAAMVGATAIWGYVLLGRVSDWHPWLRYAVLFGGLAAAALLAAARLLSKRLVATAGLVAVLACLAGPFGYSVATAAQAHSGAIPSAGPAGASTGVGGGRPGGTPGSTQGGNGFGGNQSTNGRQFNGGTGTQTGGGQFGGGMRGGGGGMALLDASTPGAELVKLLSANASQYTWVAAVTGSNSAAGYQLATRYPVMAIGGFNGTDNYPTLAQFKKYVAAGKIHYYIAGSGMGMGSSSGSQASSQIETWVKAHFSGKTVNNVTIYDLTGTA